MFLFGKTKKVTNVEIMIENKIYGVEVNSKLPRKLEDLGAAYNVNEKESELMQLEKLNKQLEEAIDNIIGEGSIAELRKEHKISADELAALGMFIVKKIMARFDTTGLASGIIDEDKAVEYKFNTN